MKTTIKLAAISALALAVSASASFAQNVGTATSPLPAGATTGLALGAPLPEGVYGIAIASYGSKPDASYSNVAYAVPVWLIWSTPWQIGGGRIMLDTLTPVGEVWNNFGNPASSWMNTLVDAGIAWNLHNGFNIGLHAGVWLPSEQVLPSVLGRNEASFQGIGSVSYVANGWNLTATTIYNERNDAGQSAYWNLDLTATKKLGKMEVGTIAYGSWEQDGAKKEQFALGGLVGYDFGSFIAQAKLASDIETNAAYGEKEVRGTLTIIKPLWNPAADSLK